jgi:hypothetical protein
MIGTEKNSARRRLRSGVSSPHVLDSSAEGRARLVWRRDGEETYADVVPADAPIIIGRSSQATVRLDDGLASRHHAELFWQPRRWWLRDGDSRNGTFLDKGRLLRPMPLSHASVIRCGNTAISFLWPDSLLSTRASSQPETVAAPAPPMLLPTELELLRLMCGVGDRSAEPPSNAELAERLHISEGAVRQRLRRMYPKFDLDETNAGKRRALVARAIETGAVTLADR